MTTYKIPKKLLESGKDFKAVKGKILKDPKKKDKYKFFKEWGTYNDTGNL